MGWFLMFLGWVGLVTGNLIWIGHAIYQLITTEMGFFAVIGANIMFWVIHMTVSLCLLWFGFFTGTIKK